MEGERDRQTDEEKTRRANTMGSSLKRRQTLDPGRDNLSVLN